VICTKLQKLYADYMDSSQWFMRRRFSKLFAIYMYINLYKTKSPWGGPYI